MASEPIPLEKAIALFIKFMNCGNAEEIVQVHNFMTEVNDNDTVGKKNSPKKSSNPKSPMQLRVTKKKGSGVRAIRPLNSYMAFRGMSYLFWYRTFQLTSLAYYSPMFSEYPQKLISGFITAMWRRDPFKAKWSIIAKAYSEIRDAQGRENAPLNSFLSFAAIALYIISPHDYQLLMGWKAELKDGACSISRTHDLDLSSFDPKILSTTMSVPELIESYQASGYSMAISKPTTQMPFDYGPIMVMTAQVHTNPTNFENSEGSSSNQHQDGSMTNSPSDIPVNEESSSADYSKQSMCETPIANDNTEPRAKSKPEGNRTIPGK